MRMCRNERFGRSLIDVNGAEQLSIGQYIEIANEVTGHNVKYVEITDEQQYSLILLEFQELWAQTATNFPFW